LFVSIMKAYAGAFDAMDLGRTDSRNRGLNEFKRRLGGTAHPLPYAYLPRAPQNISSEVLSKRLQLISNAWRRLPLWTTRVLGAVVYEYLL